MPKRIRVLLPVLALPLLTLLALAACAGSSDAPAGSPGAAGDEVTLILGAYTTPREAYGEIIPLFQAHWQAEAGQAVRVEESYLGSGAQSRAVVEGFEADVVALSLEADVNRIADAGLITHDWKTLPHGGTVSTSVVVVAAREGNPKGVHDWADLAAEGLEILTPDPMTSGGAQWSVLAMYGAAERGHVPGFPAGDAGALAFLSAVFGNVSALDKSARDSITNFEKGIGDVAITYENEVLVGRKSGQTYETVLPSSTILIENPVAVVDAHVDEHGTRAAAEAFRDFLWTPAAQRVFAAHGLRPVDEAVAAEVADQYPAVEDLFAVQEQFGGWDQVTGPFFGEDGLYGRMLEEIQRGG